MSYVDLATLTMHRRHELENRTHIFEEKCDRAINDIKNLKMKAKGFASHLNCDPPELKERFLSLMQKLDEYIYLITDFNLAMAQTADTECTESTPVKDLRSVPPSLSPFNLMDALTEPLSVATTSKAPVPPARPPPERLIVFSGSSSSESVTPPERSLQNNIASLTIEEPPNQSASSALTTQQISHKECCISSAQSVLEVDHEYQATIISVNTCYSFWVIIEDPQKVAMFMSEMTEYYTKNNITMSAADLDKMTYCAYCDEGVYYRAMFLQKPEVGQKTVNVYVIDTGEERLAPLEFVRPLVREFCDIPPFARLCHLAGLDFGESLNNRELIRRQDEFMKKYTGAQCIIYVDDNSSESLGVFVKVLPSNTTLNQLMVAQGLAYMIDRPSDTSQEEAEPRSNHGPPESEESLANIDITQCPEYEDPVVAVTGYHNRDEADICKHYKGGPDKWCFKGPRCTKKHILHHPDGWTRDRVEVMASCTPACLPPVGSWVKVCVTAVCHFDRVFVQIVKDDEELDEIPEFGRVCPPMTLASLTRDMNSPATVQAYKPLTIAPALGEIVAALYPHDNCWYRAKVLTVTRLDQSVEVMYVDYGTILWVKENQLHQLEPRFCALPLQAVQCALAGVRSSTANSSHWARAKRSLAQLTQDQKLEAHVIGRDYDEIIIELFTCEDKQNVAELLAAQGLVELVEYAEIDDVATQKLVVP